MVWNAFADRFKKPRRSQERRCRDRAAVRERSSWMTGLGGESLEQRALLAAFTYDSVAESLTIDLDNANEVITLTSSGGGAYVFTSTNFFTGTGIPANAWISATATRLVGGVPSDSSQFSLGVRARAG